MLLPVDKRPEMDEEDDEDDPRWELVRQLVEYRKFKEAASFLQEKEVQQENVFALGSDGVELDDENDISIEEVGIFDLITAFNTVLKRVEERHFGEILGSSFTVADQIEITLNAVRENKELLFTSLFEGMASRQEIVCTFLAVLELMRLSQICVTQKGRFHEIVLQSVAA
jgi:segregation and condensation protein A